MHGQPFVFVNWTTCILNFGHALYSISCQPGFWLVLCDCVFFLFCIYVLLFCLVGSLSIVVFQQLLFLSLVCAPYVYNNEYPHSGHYMYPLYTQIMCNIRTILELDIMHVFYSCTFVNEKSSKFADCFWLKQDVCTCRYKHLCICTKWCVT